MTAFKILLANGCSVAHGTEMVDCPIIDEYIDGNPSKFAWPQLLGDELLLETKNISKPGGSNERISRTTIEHVLTLLKQYKNDEILVGIMFSHMNRFEYPDDGSNFWNTYGHWYIDNKIDEKFVERIILNDYYMIYKTLQSIHALQMFLHNHNICYFMSFIKSSVTHGENNHMSFMSELDFEYLFDDIDWDKFFYVVGKNNKNISIMNLGSDNKMKRGPYNHFLEDTHKLYTDHLIPWVKNRFIDKIT